MKTSIAMLVLGLSCCVHAAAVASGSAAEPPHPYLQVRTVEGDEFRVRAFFSPSCSFSKQYLPFFLNLASTLPRDQQFAFTPVVNKADGLAYAFAFAAVQRFYPRHVNNFVDASLRGVQDLGLSTRSWAGIERIAKAAAIPVPLGRLVEGNLPVLKGDVERLITLQARLQVTNTPTVSVAGTYLVTPEFTAGDPGQFSTLVNAVISMAALQH
jgi:hypothetical protein